jgi:hypothetical protein
MYFPSSLKNQLTTGRTGITGQDQYFSWFSPVTRLVKELLPPGPFVFPRVPRG